jgi:hypothetical protein
MQLGRAARWSHDCRRHGTTTLFAALEIATGRVTAACEPRHRHQEFLAFCKHVARAYPDGELRLVMDNYAAHKRIEIRDWLAANPCPPPVWVVVTHSGFAGRSTALPSPLSSSRTSVSWP